MGLVSGLLLLPLAPVRGTLWIADQLVTEARRQTGDPRAARARLAALNDALDRGEIDEAAFEREEERLLTLLEDIPPGPGRTRPRPHRPQGRRP
ncbi:gas vesicle protein GvpG [Streptomyces flavalbus]|uniref:Gas vesicle protein GvpG n=1 Tax=Streptomyces flavalbus TaxID=2665155 RepID=A0ABW2WKS7_9ACTN